MKKTVVLLLLCFSSLRPCGLNADEITNMSHSDDKVIVSEMSQSVEKKNWFKTICKVCFKIVSECICQEVVKDIYEEITD